jgi:hypothetical protein
VKRWWWKYAGANPFSNLKSVQLNGLDEFASAGNNFGRSKTTPYTIGTFIYPDDVSGVVVGKFTALYVGYGMESSAGIVFFGDAGGFALTRYRQTTAAILTTGSWQSYVVTDDGTDTVAGKRLYKNGVAQTIMTYGDFDPGDITSTAPFGFGASDYPVYSGGKFDSGFVAIGTEFSAAEVLEWHNLVIVHRNPNIHSRYANFTEHWYMGDSNDVFNNIVGRKGGVSLNVINGDAGNIVAAAP